MSRLRWAKFFWADWAGDNALSLCSLAAQGLWMRLLCIAAQNEPYGTILISGRQPTEVELAKLIQPPIRVRDFRRLLRELEYRHVIKRDADGNLYSARLRADLTESQANSIAGTISAKKRSNVVPFVPNVAPQPGQTRAKLEPNSSQTRAKLKPRVGGSRVCDLSEINDLEERPFEPEAEAESRSRTPPYPPNRSRARSKGSVWTEMATQIAAKGGGQ